MISTAKALINSNNPNILIQLYKSENYLTKNGHVRCYRHKLVLKTDQYQTYINLPTILEKNWGEGVSHPHTPPLGTPLEILV